MEEDECFKCNLCFFNTKLFRKCSNHYVRYHKNYPSVSASCGIGACEFTTRRWNTFKVHVHRKHKIEEIQPGNVNNCNEINMVLDYHETSPVPFHSLDSLSNHNALFTMALEAKYNVTQTAIDSIVKIKLLES